MLTAPEALKGVTTVGFNVNNVVETIDGRGRKTERKEGDNACYGIIGVQQSSCKEHGNEHKPILNPLVRTN